MPKEKKTVDLTDEELSKVSGGAPATGCDCANCGYFRAKNPDGGRNFNNCSYAKPSIGACKNTLVDDNIIVAY